MYWFFYDVFASFLCKQLLLWSRKYAQKLDTMFERYVFFLLLFRRGAPATAEFGLGGKDIAEFGLGGKNIAGSRSLGSVGSFSSCNLPLNCIILDTPLIAARRVFYDTIVYRNAILF